MNSAPLTTPAAVFAHVAALRTASAAAPLSSEQVASALSRMAALWQTRLTNGWTPPDGSAFPWEMVRVSLGGLFAASRTFPLSKAERGRGHLVAIICAGNTPLLAWPALCAALLSGASVFVKMSRHETLWPRLFMQALRDVNAPELANRIHLDVWPGNDPRTLALVQAADAVVAYGSDATLTTLRAATPALTPFFGFGHALSVGLWMWRTQREISRSFDDWLPPIAAQARGFARDVLMYGQGGCLSPHTIFVEQNAKSNDVQAVCEVLFHTMADIANDLSVPPVTDAAVAHALREARDMAHFDGHTVWGSEENLHHGLVIGCENEQEMPPPVGHGVVFVVPLANVRQLPDRWGTARGKISSVGVAGTVSGEMESILRAEGVSRICEAGQMQAPPLDWPNGNVDLFSALPAALTK